MEENGGVKEEEIKASTRGRKSSQSYYNSVCTWVSHRPLKSTMAERNLYFSSSNIFFLFLPYLTLSGTTVHPIPLDRKGKLHAFDFNFSFSPTPYLMH